MSNTDSSSEAPERALLQARIEANKIAIGKLLSTIVTHPDVSDDFKNDPAVQEVLTWRSFK